MYTYDPHRHVRIWLSRDRDVFLNIENQLRFISMRYINPQAEIHLIYDRSLLSEAAIKAAHLFCARHRISLHDVQSEVIALCGSIEEQLLIALYQYEIEHLKQAGNLGVCSDILRWLSPVYKLGTYSDFDTMINTKNLPERISVQKPILLNVDSLSVDMPLKQCRSIILNNDVIAIIDEKNSIELIKKIQRSIYYTYLEPSKNNPYFKHINQLTHSLLAESDGVQVDDLIDEMTGDAFISHLSSIVENNPNKNAYALRKNIIYVTRNNDAYCKAKHTTINMFASEIRDELAQSTDAISRAKSASATDNELVIETREYHRLQFLKYSVMFTTGPMRVCAVLFWKLIYTLDEFQNDVKPYAFSHYQLESHFKSKQLYRDEATELNTCDDKFKSNDLSWLEEGWHAIAVREVRIKTAQQTLYRFFKSIKSNITAQQDLERSVLTYPS